MVRPITSSVVAGEGTLARAEDIFVYILTGLPRKTWLAAWFETRLSRGPRAEDKLVYIPTDHPPGDCHGDQLDLIPVSQERTARGDGVRKMVGGETESHNFRLLALGV